MLKYYPNLILVVVITMNILSLRAQSDVSLSNFYLNPLAYNPAYAGSFGGMSFSSYYSSQWVGFDGAPKTLFINGHGTFFNEQTGIGLEIINDEIGVTSESKILGNYSYHLQLNNSWKLAMGLKAGFSTYSVDYGKLNIENPNEMYNSYEKSVWTNYNMGLGFYLYQEKFYLGISVPNLLKNTFLQTYNNTQANSTPNYYLSSGYKLEVDKEVYLQPSILMRVIEGSAVNTLFATTLNWQDKFYGGLNVDLTSSIGGFAGFRFAEKFMVGYSYDNSITRFSKSNNGTHGFFLNIRLDNYNSKEQLGFYTF